MCESDEGEEGRRMSTNERKEWNGRMEGGVASLSVSDFISDLSRPFMTESDLINSCPLRPQCPFNLKEEKEKGDVGEEEEEVGFSLSVVSI